MVHFLTQGLFCRNDRNDLFHTVEFIVVLLYDIRRKFFEFVSADMLHKKMQPLSLEELIYPVRVAEAVHQAYTTGNEVFMKEAL